MRHGPDGITFNPPPPSHHGHLALTSFGNVASTATAYTLNSTNYLDQNTWQNPNQVTSSTTSVNGTGGTFSYTFPAHSYTILELDTTASAIGVPAVTGRVTTTTGSPLAGASVQVVGGGNATTDADGYYLIPVSAIVTYTITASKSGYTSASLFNVEVHAGGATALPIELQ